MLTYLKYIVLGWLLLFLAYPESVKAADALLLISVIECESSGRYNVYGDKGKSYGIAQFNENTFNEMKQKAHMTKLRWKNPVHQLRLMNWMLDNGYGNRWTCFNKVKGR